MWWMGFGVEWMGSVLCEGIEGAPYNIYKYIGVRFTPCWDRRDQGIQGTTTCRE
jgi:hypothetical protein